MTAKIKRLTVAVFCMAMAVASFAQSKTNEMASSVFDWKTVAEKTTPTGSTRKFFQAPTALLGELECHVTTLKPGLDPHPPHQHPEEELYIVKEGTVEVLVNGELKRVGAGSVAFMAANQPHGIRNAGTEPATYHVIKWRAPATATVQTP